MKKKLIKTLSVLSLGSVMAAPLLTSCAKKDTKTEYHIMSISDIRGEIPGYGDPDFKDLESKYPGAIRVTDAMQEIAERSKDYVILSGGDQNGSGKFSSCTQGETMYAVMKAMGIRYSAVGNHAWDWGSDKLIHTETGYDHLGRTDKTEGNYFITANVLNGPNWETYNWELDQTKPKFAEDFARWNKERVTWADPYKVIDLSGHKICLIGLTTQDTLHDGNLEYIKEFYSFSNYNAAVNYSKYLLKTTDEKTFNEIESFILLTHCGATENNSWISGDAGELANKVDTPIDAILAAHTRTPICGYVWNNKFDKKVAIAQVNDKMQSFIDLKIEFDDSKPVGQRFKSITPSIIKPTIASESFDAATAQLKAIQEHPRNEIVKNVCDVYNAQKQIALQTLKTQIGKTTNGLSYYQAHHLKEYLYPEDVKPVTHSGILVEQAGAFAAKGVLAGFNQYYDEQEYKQEDRRKANISIISNDSINRGIDPTLLESGKVTLSELYDLFPYDEHTVTASLTYYQLEQVIKYMLTGKITHTPSDKCTDEFFVNESAPAPIIYDDLQFPSGPTQFYGFAYKVIPASKSDKQFRKYEYVPESLVIYDPAEGSGCDIDDPSTWLDKTKWDARTGNDKYITLVMNSFNFDYGNRQLMMIKDFARFNESESPAPIHIYEEFSLDVRDLCRKYIEKVQDIELSDDVCKKLALLEL